MTCSGCELRMKSPSEKYCIYFGTIVVHRQNWSPSYTRKRQRYTLIRSSQIQIISVEFHNYWIQSKLHTMGSNSVRLWRIPTKSDWDCLTYDDISHYNVNQLKCEEGLATRSLPQTNLHTNSRRTTMNRLTRKISFDSIS